MIAGYETTTATLASCTYVLATKQDIQNNVVAEINEQDWKNEEHVDYDILTNMTYLDMFVREVLRMFPPATQAITRECNTTTTVCGYTVEKGLL